MHIDRTEFGSITIDGKTYDHDVKIGLDGKVTKRKKKLSKELYGTSHIISEAEAKSVFEKGCDLLIIGTGQEDNVRLSPEAEVYFGEKGCKVLLRPTPEAIGSFNQAKEDKIALMHVTC
ncbi:MAG TPA: MTH938/NDUFAF3 family protein [Acidocella sp.]|nr:MTH938/NDUFAF3 family protein [Acidocella sp.]